MSAPLVVHDLYLSLAGRLVLEHVTLRCDTGEITALVGPNGAGKSSTLSVAAGLRRADRGAVTLHGIDARASRAGYLRSLVPQEIGFPASVTVQCLLSFVEQQRRASDLAPPRDQLCDRLGLLPLLPRRVGGLSGGQQRRLALALGFLHAPPLLLLDEATTNLDESTRATAWQMTAEYAARGGTVLITSHIVADIEAHAHRIVVLDAGRVVFTGSVAEVRDRLGTSTVSIRVVAPQQRERIRDAVVAGHLARPVQAPGGDVLAWQTRDPLALVAVLAVVAPSAPELNVRPTPLNDVLRVLPVAPTV